MACKVGLCALLAGGFARAECPATVAPADAPPAWGEAARAAARRTSSVASNDCAAIEVTVGPTGAELTFTTTDGRRALRVLRSPEEIGPTLDALLVTLPAAPPRAESAPPPTPPAPAVVQPPRADRTSALVGDAAAGAETAGTHFMVGGTAGARLGLAGAYLAPTIAARPSGTFGSWELAGVVEYAPLYGSLPGGTPPAFRMWSLVVSVQVGRREALGGVGIGYGLGLGVANVHEEGDDQGTTRALDVAQPRAAAYGRLVWPRSSRVRAIFEVSFDVAANLGRKGSELRSLPDLPRWGILLGAGVETSIL